MRMVHLAPALIAALIGFTLAAPRAAASEDNIVAGIVQIFNLSADKNGEINVSSGTGFVINDRGDIVTNFHVIAGAEIIYVIPEGGSASPSQLVQGSNLSNPPITYPDQDLAILNSPIAANMRPLTLAREVPERGAEVRAVGFPGVAENLSIRTSEIRPVASFTSGSLSRLLESKFNPESDRLVQAIQHAAVTNPGNSGGPLLDACDRVIGVNTMIALDVVRGADGQVIGVTNSSAINSASHISELRRILDQSAVPYRSANNPCRGGDSADYERIMLFGALALFGLGGLVVFVMLMNNNKTAAMGPAIRPGAAPAPQQRPGRTAAPRGHTAAAPRNQVILSGLTSDGKPCRLALDAQRLARGGIHIGRGSPDTEGMILDDSVSRRHAFIILRGNEIFLRDEDSTNGTFVNGKRLHPGEEELIRPGDKIRFGRVELDAGK